MSRLLRAVGLLGLLVGMLMTSEAAADRLKLVGDAWAPYSDVALPGGGLATELVATALKRAGYTVDYAQVPWARALMGIEEGRYDVLVNAWFSDERTHIGQFSSAYMNNRIRLLKRKDRDISFETLDQLHARSIAVVRGYAYSTEFDSDSHLNKVPVPSFLTALRMLEAGRVDLAVEDEYAARFLLSREAASVRDSVEFLPSPLSENTLHILVSLKNPEHARIVNRFDHEIAAMKADGTYEALFKQHGL